ncbi:hypothetical protein [Enterococcus sp. LJL128]
MFSLENFGLFPQVLLLRLLVADGSKASAPAVTRRSSMLVCASAPTVYRDST